MRAHVSWEKSASLKLLDSLSVMALRFSVLARVMEQDESGIERHEFKVDFMSWL